MTTIKLYDMPRNTIIHLRPPQEASDGSTWFEFCHVDGMYAINRTEKGGYLHLMAWAEITHDGERYWLE